MFISLISSNLHIKSRGNYPTHGSLVTSSAVSMKTTVGITCKVRLHEMKQLNWGEAEEGMAGITLYFSRNNLCSSNHIWAEKGLIRWARR